MQLSHNGRKVEHLGNNTGQLYFPQIPNSLHPRTQMKQARKTPRNPSVPYSDHLTHHISELKAHSICTIIEPRDPKTFKFPAAADVALSEGDSPTARDPQREHRLVLRFKVNGAICHTVHTVFVQYLLIRSTTN